jgi:carbon storage regulator
MLVLTRKVGETLRIGDDIEITVTDISGDKVRIGIVAPAELKILRGELTLTIAENREAARGPAADALRQLLTKL